jgi:hypothetical protein
MSRFFHA